MKTQSLTLSLIKSAQQGDEDSRSMVAELIRPKVYAYLYRMTLDTHLAEDLCQETMVSLIQNLRQLTIKAPSFLWAWVYKTALNQIRDHYDHQSVIQSGKIQMKQILSQSARNGWKKQTGLDYVIHQELLTAIFRAINTLKLQYRNVLTLRCFQQLSYAEIAHVIGKSELGARMLFFRAKRSLTQQLARAGFKKSLLLPGLTLFAAATIAPVEKASAVTINAATIHTGAGIKLLTVLGTTKLGISITAILAASFISLGVFIIGDNSQSHRFHTVPSAETTQAELAYPVAIRGVYDPDGDGWQGALVRKQDYSLVQISLDQWLMNPTGPDALWIHMPRDHWLEVEFDGQIINGEGDDILIIERCCHGEKAELYLTDNNSNMFLLGSLQIPHTGEHGLMTYGFDLSDVVLPFPPTAIRIRTTDNGFREDTFVQPGLELQQIRARIQISQ